MRTGACKTRSHAARVLSLVAALAGAAVPAGAAQEPGAPQPPAAPPSIVEPPSVPLTIGTALEQALARQPAVTAAQQRVTQARFRLAGALAIPNTLIDVGHGQEITHGSVGATGADQDILITQHLELFG